MGQKSISASKFKEQCLSLLDTIEPEGLVITKHGKPVARLVPIGQENASLVGALSGKLKIHGAIFSTGTKWNAQS